MGQEAGNTTGQDATPPVAPKKARKAPVDRAEQDRLLTADSGNALALMDGIQGDDEIAAIMAGRGYPTERFTEGRDLQQALEDSIGARQTAMGIAEDAVTALEAQDLAARTRYADFRGTATPVFAKAADRTTLKLTGNVPKDRKRFIALARVSYKAAKTATYQKVLKDYGETTDALNAALQGLKDLDDADTMQNRAAGAAERATKLRDSAHKSLMAWIRQLRSLTRNALKKRPDLLTKLEL